MSIDTFIPEIWSGVVQTAAERRLVYADLCDREFEGEVSDAGDTVTINALGDPTVATYTPNSTSITPEQLATTQQKLLIDQAKYFAFKVDDVDKRQAKGDLMTKALTRSAYRIARAIDDYLVALYTGVASGNALGTVAVTSSDLAYQKLIALKVVLDEADVPDEGRWAVVPPWYEGLLLDNNKFVANAALPQTGRALLTGHIGQAAGFDVFKSNANPNVTGDDWLVWCGVREALALVVQINKVAAYQPESSFADAMKGLALYGAKLVRPDYVATMVASKT